METLLKPAAQPSSESTPPKRLEVVIIDDNPVNLLLLKKLVLGLGTGEPVCFEDPLEALSHCLEQPPAVIVTDYMMPGMDGLELVEKLQQAERTRDVLVLMVTAVEDRDLMKEALKAGVTDFLTKPVDGVEFRLRLRTLLRLATAINNEKSHKTIPTIPSTPIIQTAPAIDQSMLSEADLTQCLARITNYSVGRGETRSLRIARFVGCIARSLAMEADRVASLEQAALFYDIGQIGIPIQILDKTDPLNAEEFASIQKHVDIGAAILQNSNHPILQESAQMAQSHHEAFDGSGYPKQLAGNEIPVGARIVAVADVFDALTQPRPHRAAWSIENATVFILQQAGKRFDPSVVTAFARCVEELLQIRDEVDATQTIS